MHSGYSCPDPHFFPSPALNTPTPTSLQVLFAQWCLFCDLCFSILVSKAIMGHYLIHESGREQVVCWTVEREERERKIM